MQILRYSQILERIDGRFDSYHLTKKRNEQTHRLSLSQINKSPLRYDRIDVRAQCYAPNRTKQGEVLRGLPIGVDI